MHDNICMNKNIGRLTFYPGVQIPIMIFHKTLT
jgi:hypothetical protein